MMMAKYVWDIGCWRFSYLWQEYNGFWYLLEPRDENLSIMDAHWQNLSTAIFTLVMGFV